MVMSQFGKVAETKQLNHWLRYIIVDNMYIYIYNIYIYIHIYTYIYIYTYVYI